MKITFINTHDLIGGAERCSYSLASELFKTEEKVDLIVGRKIGTDPFVKQLRYRYFDWKFRIFAVTVLGLTETTIMAPLYYSFIWPELINADLFSVHNMHGGYWNFWTLPILAKRAPIVLTLHDEWFLTGDCAYSYDCNRWLLNRCGNCPQASIPDRTSRYSIGGRDTTKFNLLLKHFCMSMVPASRLMVVTPSRWLFHKAKKVKHLRKFEFFHIENGIDLSTYRPLDKMQSRRELKLPVDKKLIFSALVDYHDRRKNFQFISEALQNGDWPENTYLVCAGRISDDKKAKFAGLPVIFLGFLESHEVMAKALSACDVSLLISKADNLPYTGLESLACGCPVIGSDVGGIPEIITHGVTGFILPKVSSSNDLIGAIHSVLQMPAEKYEELCRNARSDATKRFGMSRFVGKYRQLFQRIHDQSFCGE